MLDSVRQWIKKRSEPNPRDIAKQRLRVVIEIDRGGGISPNILDQLRRDIQSVLQKYPSFDFQALDIEFQDKDQRQRIQIVVPIRKNEGAVEN